MVSWRDIVLGLAQVALIPAVTALGCANCLNYDKGLITSICHKACADPKIGFRKPNEVTNCQQYCDHFVNDQKCCNTVTCAADPFTCTHPQRLSSRDTESDKAALRELESIERDPSLLDLSRLVSRDPPYHMIRSTEDLRSLNPRALAHWQMEGSQTTGLQTRSNAEVCCLIAKGMVWGAQTMLPSAYQSEDNFHALIILSAIGMGAAWTCGKLYAMPCNV